MHTLPPIGSHLDLNRYERLMAILNATAIRALQIDPLFLGLRVSPLRGVPEHVLRITHLMRHPRQEIGHSMVIRRCKRHAFPGLPRAVPELLREGSRIYTPTEHSTF